MRSSDVPTPILIREVARDLFAGRGYPATSMRDIAEGVGIQASSLYNHFASKEDILWDLTRAALESLNDSWCRVDGALRSPTPEIRLRAFVSAHVRFHAENAKGARIINGELKRLSPDHFAKARKMRHEYEDVLAELVVAASDSDALSSVDLRVIVFAILQMGMAIAGWYRADGQLTVLELEESYSELALRMVRSRHR